jgi:NAD(P)H-dependent FMN reductase
LKVVAVSGSLRAGSVNSALLRAAALLAPSDMTITLYEEVAALPHFNPDLEAAAPPAVARWQNLLRECDALLIACPEYAHGVPGSFKNALDWVVGTMDLADKPVALLNTSPRAQHAHAALAEIITTMGWKVVEAASVRIPCARKGVELGNPGDMAEFAESLLDALLALRDAAQHHVGQRFPAS